jgi:hypothetical protein
LSRSISWSCTNMARGVAARVSLKSLPRSTLRTFARRFTMVPTGHASREWGSRTRSDKFVHGGISLATGITPNGFHSSFVAASRADASHGPHGSWSARRAAEKFRLARSNLPRDMAKRAGATSPVVTPTARRIKTRGRAPPSRKPFAGVLNQD